MNTRRYGKLGLIAGLSAVLGLAACFAPEEEYEEGESAVTNVAEGTIVDVKINPEYAEKCAGGTCPPGEKKGQEASDVALIIVDGDLSAHPTIPVDLDAVEIGAALLGVESDLGFSAAADKRCKTIDQSRFADTSAGTPAAALITYAAAAQDPMRLGTSTQYEGVTDFAALTAKYLVSKGLSAPSAGGNLCKEDFGAPLFRKEHAAVVGVASSIVERPNRPRIGSSSLHARVDEASGIGTWLRGLGVTVTKTSMPVATAGEATERVPAEDAGMAVPNDDAGAEAPAEDADAGDAAAAVPNENPGAGGGEGELVAPSSDITKLVDATVVLNKTCAGVKVGPRHILTAASCITSTAELAASVAPGKPISLMFKGTLGGAPQPSDDGGATSPPADDGGATNPPPSDGGTTNPPPSDGGGTTNPPPSDGGSTTTPPPPPPPEEEDGASMPLPPTGEEEGNPDDGVELPDYDYTGSELSPTDTLDGGKRPAKKKKTQSSGCSAAPGGAGTDGLAIGLGLAVAAVVARRRRQA